MCEAGTSGLLGLAIVLFAFSSGLKENNLRVEQDNATVIHYSVEPSDFVEVLGFKKHISDHFGQADLVSNVNETHPKTLIKKCCVWNSYLDVTSLRCVPEDAGPGFFGGRIIDSNVHFAHLRRQGIPDCAPQEVLTVRLAMRAAVGASGLAIEGEGVFSQYCVDHYSKRSEEIVVLTCMDPVLFCRRKPCYRKCCPLGQAYDLRERHCQTAEEPFRPVFYNLSSLTRVEFPWEFGVFLSDACGSKGKFMLERDSGEESYLGVDGILWVPAFEKRFTEREFCVEFVKTKNLSSLESFLCFSKSGNQFENSPLQFFLLSLGFITSCTFLLLTFLVYLFSPKCQNLYGKTLMCYIVSLFAAYLCLAIIELKSREVDSSVCTYLGYFLLFAFLAAFFWLNVISFDIWKTFRVNRSIERTKNEKRKLQFFVYSFYAWGLPAIITALCAYVNQAKSFPYEVIKPDIGVENCWFSSEWVQLLLLSSALLSVNASGFLFLEKKKGIYVFFIVPISLLIALNIVFFVQTAWKIWKVKSDVMKIEKQKTKKFSANKDQFIINGKLFVVMGITWSLEIISYFAPHPVWYITDAANALHGVFIFAVFVLKKKVLHKVSEQVMIPLRKVRQLTNSEELFSKKTVTTSTQMKKLHETLF